MTSEKIIEELLHKAYEKGIYKELMKKINDNYPNRRVELYMWEKHYIDLIEKVKEKTCQEPL